MNIGFDEDVDTSDTIERNLNVFVVAPVAHLGHICAAGLVLLVACIGCVSSVAGGCLVGEGWHTFSEDDILVQTSGKLEGLIALLPAVVVESPLNVDSVFVTMEPDVGDEHVSVVGDKVLDDLAGAVFDVDVPPVDPGMLGLEGGREKVVSGAAHGLSARALGGETVAVLDGLRDMDAEILLDNHDAAEGQVVGLCRLDALKLLGQDGQGVVGRVANQEGQVDQVVGVGELGDEIKVVVDVRGGVAERSEQQDALLVGGGLGGGLDGVEVDALNGGGVDFDRGMVVEQDGGLVGAPEHLLVGRHLHG